jgi:hypothetical protein
MMKWVEIRTLGGQIIVCGAMGKESFFRYIDEYTDGSNGKLAARLWDKATPYSLSDYIYNIKVRVTEYTA